MSTFQSIASLLVTMAGASGWVNGLGWGMYVCLAGILATLVVMYRWFGDAIAESEGGKYNARIDVSYRASRLPPNFGRIGRIFQPNFKGRVRLCPAQQRVVEGNQPLSLRCPGVAVAHRRAPGGARRDGGAAPRAAPPARRGVRRGL